MKNFKGKTAFITGGGSGIGLGIAKVFAAKAGMNIVLADLRKEALDEAIVWFKKRDPPAHPIQLDVTDREAYLKAADEAENKFKKIHVLINPERYKNGNEPETPPPPPQPPANAPKIDPARVVMDPVEADRVLRGIKRKDIFIMSHPVYGEGIYTRHKALMRSIPDEPPDHERDEVLRSFGAMINNLEYEEQTTPGVPDWDLSEDLTE